MSTVEAIYNETMCVICYESFEKKRKNTCLILKCHHIFHEKCVEKWLYDQQSCPLCRKRAIAPITWKGALKEGVSTARRTARGVAKKALLLFIALAIINLFNGSMPKDRLSFIDDEEPNRPSPYQEDLDVKISLLVMGIIIGLGAPLITGLCSAGNALSKRGGDEPFLSKRINYNPK